MPLHAEASRTKKDGRAHISQFLLEVGHVQGFDHCVQNGVELRFFQRKRHCRLRLPPVSHDDPSADGFLVNLRYIHWSALRSTHFNASKAPLQVLDHVGECILGPVLQLSQSSRAEYDRSSRSCDMILFVLFPPHPLRLSTLTTVNSFFPSDIKFVAENLHFYIPMMMNALSKFNNLTTKVSASLSSVGRAAVDAYCEFVDQVCRVFNHPRCQKRDS